MTVGVLLLAAGGSQRFGSDKRLSHLGDGSQLLFRSIETVLQSGLPLIVCLRHSDHELASTLRSRKISCRQCPNSGKGMSDTLADGIAALPPSWSGVLVGLGDMPLIQADTYRQVANAMGAAKIVVPSCNEKTGHPVGFDRKFFSTLIKLTGDRGARGVLAANAQAIVSLAVNDPGILTDVDTDADLASLAYK